MWAFQGVLHYRKNEQCKKLRFMRNELGRSGLAPFISRGLQGHYWWAPETSETLAAKSKRASSPLTAVFVLPRTVASLQRSGAERKQPETNSREPHPQSRSERPSLA